MKGTSALSTRHVKAVIILAALATTGVIARSVFAYAAYHGNWNAQPDWGNHWWYNNTGGTVDWYADDYWSTSRANSLRWEHNNFPYYEFRIEQEAYNPGAGSHCDRLAISSYSTLGLPVTSWQPVNCPNSSSSYLEELRIDLDENAVPANTWLRHRATYQKINACSGGPGEVNYSFSHSWAWTDSWMGKITYDACFNKTGSDRPGLVN